MTHFNHFKHSSYARVTKLGFTWMHLWRLAARENGSDNLPYMRSSCWEKSFCCLRIAAINYLFIYTVRTICGGKQVVSTGFWKHFGWDTKSTTKWITFLPAYCLPNSMKQKNTSNQRFTSTWSFVSHRSLNITVTRKPTLGNLWLIREQTCVSIEVIAMSGFI